MKAQPLTKKYISMSDSSRDFSKPSGFSVPSDDNNDVVNFFSEFNEYLKDNQEFFSNIISKMGQENPQNENNNISDLNNMIKTLDHLGNNGDAFAVELRNIVSTLFTSADDQSADTDTGSMLNKLLASIENISVKIRSGLAKEISPSPQKAPDKISVDISNLVNQAGLDYLFAYTITHRVNNNLYPVTGLLSEFDENDEVYRSIKSLQKVIAGDNDAFNLSHYDNYQPPENFLKTLEKISMIDGLNENEKIIFHCNGNTNINKLSQTFLDYLGNLKQHIDISYKLFEQKCKEKETLVRAQINSEIDDFIKSQDDDTAVSTKISQITENIEDDNMIEMYRIARRSMNNAIKMIDSYIDVIAKATDKGLWFDLKTGRLFISELVAA